MGSRKQKIRDMKKSMDELGEEYGVEEPKIKSKEKKKKKIKRKKDLTPFSAFGLAKKIKKRGKQLRKSVQE